MVSVENGLIALFLVVTGLLVYKYRSKLVIQKPPILFPLFYVVMYKSRVGINLMNRMALKFPRLLKFLGFASILVGFLGMGVVVYSILQSFLDVFTKPEAAAGVAPVLPINIDGVFFVPFFYWIISIFVLAVVHEFSHGVIARVYKMPLKSTGFAFIGILLPLIPFAFVEPNEAAMARRSLKQQLSVLGAGAFSNILLGVVLFFLFVAAAPAISNALLEFDGVDIEGFVDGNSPLKDAGVSEGERITGFNNIQVTHYTNFTDALENTKPGETVRITTNVSEYSVVLGKNPDVPERGFLGVFAVPHSEIKEEAQSRLGGFFVPVVFWFLGLWATMYILNIGVGLFNLVPIGPIDGGRMFKLVSVKFLGKGKGEKLWKYVSIATALMVMMLLLFAFVK